MIVATSRNRQTQKSEPLTRKEEYAFILQSQSGDTRTRDRFIEKNMRLIRAVASKYQGLAEWNDLENVGRLGVAVAIAKFDITKGYKFSTYATGPIKTEIKQLINELRGLSRTITDHLRKIDEASHELELELEREPTLVEIADRTGYSKQIITNAWNKERVVQTHSLNKLIGENHDSEFIDLIEGSDNTWDFAEEISAYEYISQLPEREAYIIQARQKGYTNQEIGEVLELSKERIRQLFNKALTTLKHLVDFGTDIARCPQQEQPQTIETTSSVSTHHNIETSCEDGEHSPDLTTPEVVREPVVKRVDALCLGGLIGRVIKNIMSQPENQQSHRLGQVRGAGQRCLEVSQVIFQQPLASAYQRIRGFGDKLRQWKGNIQFSLTNVFVRFGIGQGSSLPRPPTDYKDNFSLETNSFLSGGKNMFAAKHLVLGCLFMLGLSMAPALSSQANPLIASVSNTYKSAQEYLIDLESLQTDIANQKAEIARAGPDQTQYSTFPINSL